MRKILLLLLVSVSAAAQPLSLSPTFEINPRIKEIKWLYLPSLNAWRAETNWQSERFQVTVLRAKPPTFANSFSVQQEWKNQSKRKPATDKQLEDKGCERKGRVHFHCERMINENHDFLVIENLFWNEKSDLVVVRISTGKNREKLQKFAQLFDYKATSRLPASKNKRGQK
ncbi:MAG: hypothetical protein ACAH59_05235 [Pseudobdellovibrionaceae bacterium]